VVTFLDSSVMFDLEDGDAVELDAAESYRVTLSKDAAGADVVTKGPKSEAILWPDLPDDNVFVEHLVVTSADGVAVTVSPASLTGGRTYAGLHARAGTGLQVLVSMGEAISATDLRDRISHEQPVDVAASVTNRIWLTATGELTATSTDEPPDIGAQLLWYAETDGAGVTALTDARKFTHRALTTWREEMRYTAVLSEVDTPALAIALAYLGEDGELDAVEFTVTSLPAEWTSGDLKIDVRYFAPGAAVPFPAGGAGAGGASIFTDSGTHDERPVISWDADSLRVVVLFHQVRRFTAGTAFVLDLVGTVATSAPEAEQMIRAALHFRRYR